MATLNAMKGDASPSLRSSLTVSLQNRSAQQGCLDVALVLEKVAKVRQRSVELLDKIGKTVPSVRAFYNPAS